VADDGTEHVFEGGLLWTDAAAPTDPTSPRIDLAAHGDDIGDNGGAPLERTITITIRVDLGGGWRGCWSAIQMPMAEGAGTTVYGELSVNVFDETGTAILCTTSIPIPSQTLEVVAGATTLVPVFADLDPSMCEVALIGDVGITGVTPSWGYMYSGGTPWLSQNLSWADGNPTQPYEFTGLQRTVYHPYGYLYFDGDHSGEYLQLPYYDQPGADLSGGGTVRRDFLLDGAFIEGTVALSGPAASSMTSGSQSYSGQWIYDPSTDTYGPSAGGNGSGPISAVDGSYGLVLTPGDWQAQTQLSFYSSPGGVTNCGYLYIYGGPTLTAEAGTTTTAPLQEVSVSTGVITFDVIEPDGSPVIGITNPYVYSSSYDPATGRSTTAYSYAYVNNAATPSVNVVALPGTYSFTAYATVNGAQTTFAASTITIGTAVGTPAGTGVVVVPEDSQGNPTPITVTFGEVTTGGETTASVTDIGPGAPAGYSLLGIVGGDQFLNLSTSATFDEAEVCVTYDPAELGLSTDDEAELVLQEFLCDDSGNCAWVVLPGGTVDLSTHTLCGTATELGTFGITLPDAPVVTVEGTCVGAPDAAAALTTDPGFCSVYVDNANGLAGGCSEDGLASCLFDGEPGAELPPGAWTVAVVANGVDGSSDSCESYVDVFDYEAPSIACAAAQTVECTGATTAASVTASCGDNCEACSTSCGEPDFGLGGTTVSCSALDASGNSSSCTTTVEVVDTTAPALSFAASPSQLWPPNHKLVAIALPVTTSDACDALPVVDCSATSNEPDNGLGDGDRADDIQWVDGGLLLRAERSGLGGGRVYTITCTATDGSGNVTTAQSTVTVAHDQAEEPPPAPPAPASNAVRGNGRGR
jgi:hypothetical protein